jgi:predicted kinase
MERELTMLVGLPASGKSTFAEYLMYSWDLDYLISPDDIRADKFGVQFDQAVEKEVWDVTKGRLGACLASGGRCLLDATNLDPERRRGLLALAKDQGARTRAIAIHIEPELARLRNRKREPRYVEGREIARAVPEAVMDRMERLWEASGLGNTEGSIREALKSDFDEVQVVERRPDAGECRALGGKLVGSDRPAQACELREKGDLSATIRRLELQRRDG